MGLKSGLIGRLFVVVRFGVCNLRAMILIPSSIAWILR